jgi:ABC-2 type transport system ATP-binding protein
MIPAIGVEQLSKDYRRAWRRKPVPALCGISLQVEQGETFGFIGPNGAGKSTTIKILIGIAEASSGTAQLFGVPVSNPAARIGVGYVPENPYLHDYLTPLEILSMSLRLHRVVLPDPKSHARMWLDRLQLGDVASKAIRTFSKGMTQRVAIAQALCINPRLLILDEPLSGLDPVGRRDVVEILTEYKRGGGTLFFTSHVLHDVERLADRFGLIHQGQLRAVRSPAELAGDEDLVMVRSMGDAAVDGMKPDFAGRWIGEFPRSDLWLKLESLRNAGHLLLEVKPTLSLESAFLRAVERN